MRVEVLGWSSLIFPLIIRICFRVLFAPLLFVHFADFWMADQTNSMVPMFLDVQTFFCFYSKNSNLSYIDGKCLHLVDFTLNNSWVFLPQRITFALHSEAILDRYLHCCLPGFDVHNVCADL